MHGLHLCLRTLGVGHIRDTQCGFKVRLPFSISFLYPFANPTIPTCPSQLFTRKSARSLFPPMHIAHWIFDVELLLLARLVQCLGEAVRNVVAALETRLDIREPRDVERDDVLVELAPARRHPVRQLLQQREEVNEVRDRARRVPARWVA